MNGLLDRWSILHATCGVFFGLLFYFIGLESLQAILAGFGVAIGWEIFERITENKETISNSIADVFVAGIPALISYILCKSFLVHDQLKQYKNYIIITVILITVIGFTIWLKNLLKR